MKEGNNAMPDGLIIYRHRG